MITDNGKPVFIVMTVALLIGALTACGKTPASPENAASGSPAGNDAPPTHIKVLAQLFDEAPSAENNSVLSYIDKAENVQLDIDFVPSPVYNDKLNLAIASNDTYDLIQFTNAQDITKYVKQGAFHELTNVIKGKNNLEFIPDNAWKATEVGEKRYMIPKPKYAYGAGDANIVMRKDWLDEYNLPVPKTLDDFTNDLKIFKEKDPAGGGRTVPWVVVGNLPKADSGVFAKTEPVRYALGLPNQYRIDNGKPLQTLETPEYKAYLDYLKQAWANKLIDKDSLVFKGTQAETKFESGVVGAYVGNASALGLVSDTLKQSVPDAELVVVPYLEGPSGKKGVTLTEGYFGAWVIPSRIPDDKVEKIVELLDWFASEDNLYVAHAGLKGVHSSNWINGVPVQTPEQTKLFMREEPGDLILEPRYYSYDYAGSPDPAINKMQRDILDSNAKIGIPNPFIGLRSDTESKNPDNLKNVTAAALKYVIGAGTWDSVKAEIDKWSGGVGTQIKQEYMDQYIGQEGQR